MKRWKAYRMLSCNISISVIYLLNANDIPRVLDSLVSCTHKSNNLVKSWVKSSNRKNRLVHALPNRLHEYSCIWLSYFLSVFVACLFVVCSFICCLFILLFIYLLSVYLFVVYLFISCLFVCLFFNIMFSNPMVVSHKITHILSTELALLYNVIIGGGPT